MFFDQKGALIMIHSLRVRIVTAVLVALLLALAAANPILPEIAGFGGAAQADECTGSTC